MKTNLLTAAVVASLVSGGIASAAETRSAASLPSQATVKSAPAAYGAATVSRSTKNVKNESEFAGLAFLPLFFIGVAAALGIYFATKSKG